ncbi:MAG: M23 family metallopeptidase [Maribacter sp.]|jgi:murein DD-endopeptidase MepM/ murein hydrolase activator NlpD
MVLIFAIGLHLILIIFFSGLNWFSVKGYIPPENAIDLVSPFRNGKQIVLHGGASPFTNGHFHVKPQNYALDIVGLNTLGMRSTSFAGGANLDNYVIYGEPIYSPCDGTIVIVVDRYDDQNPPLTDTEHLAGNHILIESEGVEILLAHLKKGSTMVKEGDIVTTNSILGQVGNTGNTSEPHLHMHVERGGNPKTILNGNPVPFTINERFLVRGDVLRSIKKNDANQ